MNPWDNRLTLINILQHLEDIAEAGQKKEIKSLLAQFLQNAGPSAIESMLNYWDQEYTHGWEDLLGMIMKRQPEMTCHRTSKGGHTASGESFARWLRGRRFGREARRGRFRMGVGTLPRFVHAPTMIVLRVAEQKCFFVGL